LWLYKTDKQQRQKLITKNLSEIVKPKWSPSGKFIVFTIDQTRETNAKNNQDQYQIQLYDIASDNLLSIEIGDEPPTDITWSNHDASLYFTTIASKDIAGDIEWKDVIRYRQSKSNDRSNIYRLDIIRKKRRVFVEITHMHSLDFIVGQLLFSCTNQKFIVASVSAIVEDLSLLEIYSIDVHNSSSLTRLTNNEGIEQNLQLSKDGRHVFFQLYPLSSRTDEFTNTQERLYSVDLVNGHIERWGKYFNGNIVSYAIRSEGGVYILGQTGINVQIYIQESPWQYSILQSGWNGTYQSLSASLSNRHSSIAFTHSSFEQPEEIYFVDHINDIFCATAITHVNQYLTQRNLPQATAYQWINNDDNRTIEGILHYPPGQFEGKKLPLLVLIHGGPSSASLNLFHANWLTWAPLAATEGWLVFEPNYRGSTGYGDAFINEVRFQVLSRPGKDILDGVDRLIADGIADPTRLAIGGYSYGGFLTNWLITQTTRFNAAVSGAGLIEQVSSWGLTDIPAYFKGLIGGFPWDIPQRYQDESAIYQLDKVRTPTHLVTGENDIRVPVAQSYILERGLHSLGIPVQLLLFPKEGHSLRINPWHGKIKVREELKWLEKYGHATSI
jgi:dipeptidyl aminopeptidase/acylaminoacyl peptidase